MRITRLNKREIEGADSKAKLGIAKPISASEETLGVLPWLS